MESLKVLGCKRGTAGIAPQADGADRPLMNQEGPAEQASPFGFPGLTAARRRRRRTGPGDERPPFLDRPPDGPGRALGKGLIVGGPGQIDDRPVVSIADHETTPGGLALAAGEVEQSR
jgi:hypothetical protein